MKSLGILLSGRGSNFVAIADSIAAGRIPGARITVVISNNPGAPGIAIAREKGIEALIIPSKGRTREEHDREVVTALQQRGVDLVCLAGYMRLLSSWFVQQFPRRILPSPTATSGRPRPEVPEKSCIPDPPRLWAVPFPAAGLHQGRLLLQFLSAGAGRKHSAIRRCNQKIPEPARPPAPGAGRVSALRPER